MNTNMEKKARKRLHVSNIPYELKKSDLIDLFSSVGPVLDCELIHDKTTGKFKGSAKIEYPDNYSVKAALRNLNRYEIKGRFLKLNFANTDKFPTDKSEIINEDELSDPEEFESKNLEKDMSEVVNGLQNSQKIFLLEELRHLCDSNEEEFRNLLLQDPKMAQLFLSLQRDLKLDRPDRNLIEDDARNQGRFGYPGGRGPTHQTLPGSIPHQRRMQFQNRSPGIQRRGTAYNPGGVMPNPRLHQSQMSIEEPSGGTEMMGVQGMRRNERQQFYQGNDQRQFNPNVNQQNVQNRMYYNSNNRMF